LSKSEFVTKSEQEIRAEQNPTYNSTSSPAVTTGIGTEINRNVLYTDGAQYVAEAVYWSETIYKFSAK